MRNRIEVALQVRVIHGLKPLFQMSANLLQRLMRRAVRTEPLTTGAVIRLCLSRDKVGLGLRPRPSNLQSRLRRSAPVSAGLPSAPHGPAPSGFPTVSSFRWLSVCTRGALVAACRFSLAGLPEFLQQTRSRRFPARRSVRSLRDPLRVRRDWRAPASTPLPVRPADRSGRTNT